MRKILYKVHKLLGLSLGLITAIVFLSGSAVVFAPEIDRALNPTLLSSTPVTTTEDSQNSLRQAQPTLQEMVTTATAEYRWGQPSFVNLVLARDEGVHKVLMKERFGEGSGPWFEALLDPTTGDLLGTRQPQESFAGWLIGLHVHLLLGEGGIGESLVGVFGGILFLLFAFTGVLVWWPGMGRLRKGFRLRSHKGSELLFRDIHRGLGVISLPIVFVSVLTGLTLVFPAYMKPALLFFLPKAAPPVASSPWVAPRSAHKITVDQAALIASERFPEAEVTSISVPVSSDKSYKIRLRRQGDPQQYYSNGRLQVSVRASGGQIHEVVDENLKPIANSLTDVWLFPLHTGELFGFFGRLLVFIIGFVPPLLYFSGVFVNWKRRERKRGRNPDGESRRSAMSWS